MEALNNARYRENLASLIRYRISRLDLWGLGFSDLTDTSVGDSGGSGAAVVWCIVQIFSVGRSVIGPWFSSGGGVAVATSGYPQTITDALGKSTTFVYDDRGQVLKVTDALLKDTTQTYDTFGQPLVKRGSSTLGGQATCSRSLP